MGDDDGFEITFVSAEQFHELMRDDHERPTPGLRAMAAAARLCDDVAREAERHGGFVQALKHADDHG
jgi:hypothetical protein